jgi:hypothetical protein
MAVHNSTKEEIELSFGNRALSFEQYPYAFLLLLCDELQDWGRSIDGKDKSELRGIDVRFPNGNPLVVANIKILNRQKRSDIKKLRRKIQTEGLLHVMINDDSGNSLT